jgi:acylphosphatase
VQTVKQISQKKQSCRRPAKNIAHRRRVWLHPAVPIQPPASAPTVERRRLNIYYSGRVQGVGFRYTVKNVAAGFEIAGLVRNLPDGRVELVAEGVRAELAAFRDAIRGAGLAGFINREEVSWNEAQNEFHGFEISR